MRLLLVAVTLSIAFPAAAQLYVCNNDGKISISSEAVGANCRLQKSYERGNQLPATAVPEKATPPAPAPDSKAKQPSAGARQYPVVSVGTQKIRDKKRGQILLYELEKEQKRVKVTHQQIAKARTAPPTDENKYLLAHLEHQLHIHHQNITAIQQELARL